MNIDPHKYERLGQRVRGIAILLDAAPRNWTSQLQIYVRLAQVLKQLGVRLILVFAETLPPEIEQRLVEAGAEIEAVPYRGAASRYYSELGRIFRKYPISMVHVSYFDYFSLIPWLVRLHGMKTILYEELNSGMLTATSWKKKLLQLRTLLTSFPMTRVIAVSEFVKQDLVKRGIAADRIVVKYLAADDTRFTPDPSARARWGSEYSIRPDELVLSSLTFLRPFKNPETLVEAFGVLAKRGVPAHLFVGGDGAMLDDLKSLTARLGVNDRVHWLGFWREPVRLLQASDGFLLASVAEAGAFVLSEAMLCGVPIIGSRSGVIPEYVEEGKTGFLAEPRDPASFANAIAKLAADEGLRRSMAVLSRERALQNFTTDVHVENTLRIYESVC